MNQNCIRLSVAAIALTAGAVAQAADHREAPIIREDATADIADIYAFLSPTDPDRLVLAMTVNPLSAPSENVTYSFSPNVRYRFHIDTNGDAHADGIVTALFSDPVDGPQQFAISTTSGAVVSGPVTPGTEEPVANDPIITTAGDLTAFAGQRDDPFFFDVAGFNRFLAGTGGFAGNDGFAGLNVSAIVVELPLSMAGGAGDDSNSDSDSDSDSGSREDLDPDSPTAGNGPLQIWGTTERQKMTVRRGNKGKLEKHKGAWQRHERMGNPAISTALLPLDQKDLFNLGRPADDATDFAGFIVASLQSLGTNDENIGILASVAVPDTLKLDPTAPIGYPNGRAPADDVIDTLLFFIFNQTPVADGVDGNDMPFPAGFPYLASPHQPD